MSLIAHTIPVGGDEPVHVAASNCSCQPIILPAEHPGEEDVMVHHAWDCREARERQGRVEQGNAWVIVVGSREEMA